MIFENLKDSISKYCDLNGLVRRGLAVAPEEICDIVILAPWWKPEKIFEKYDVEIKQITNEFPQVYCITYQGRKFNYIRTGIGAPVCAQVALTLGFTSCKKIIFIGSVGSLSKNIPIGTVIVPSASISGEGFSVYLNETINNTTFEKEFYPSSSLRNKILSIAEENKMVVIDSKVYSIDNILAEFMHLDEIINKGAEAIEMETSAVFNACNITKKECAAILVVSDNNIENKSIVSGRADEEIEYYHHIRESIVPDIILQLL